MLPMSAVLEEYLDEKGQSPFGRWFDGLEARAAAKVVVALNRIERGAVSSVEGVGEGVLEFKIDFGPGYRIYFGQDGARLVILLAGGTKSRQGRDIADAKARWSKYKARRRASGRKGDA